jgi:hypothetical protein
MRQSITQIRNHAAVRHPEFSEIVSDEYLPRNPRECPHRIVAGLDIAQDLDAAAVVGVGGWRWRDLAFFPVEKLYAKAFFQFSDVLGNTRLRGMLADCSGRKRTLPVGGHKNPNIPQTFRHGSSRALMVATRCRQDTQPITQPPLGFA